MTEDRDIYNVEATRWPLGFNLNINGPDGYKGASQTNFIDDATHAARNHIATERGIPADSFEIRLLPQSTSFYLALLGLALFQQKIRWTVGRFCAYMVFGGFVSAGLSGLVTFPLPHSVGVWPFYGLTLAFAVCFVALSFKFFE